MQGRNEHVYIIGNRLSDFHEGLFALAFVQRERDVLQ